MQQENKINLHIVDMRTELSKALDSNAIRLTSVLRVDNKAPLLVYVEDLQDVSFWQQMFDCVKEYYSEINVTTLKEAALNNCSEQDSVGNTLCATGKDALMKVQGLGVHKVIAVDRDYDGLIPNYHYYSDRIDSDSFVIPTTYYALENHLVLPMSINQHLQNIINSNKDYTTCYQTLLDRYNDILCPIIFLLIACIEKRIKEKCKQDYLMSDLSSDLSILNQNPDINIFKECYTRILSYREALLKKYESDIKKNKMRLSELYPSNTLWKILQGHILFSFVKGYMLSVIKAEYDSSVSQLYIRYKDNKLNLNRAMRNLKESMFKGYANYTECVNHILYDSPIVDLEDSGTYEIIRRIKNILKTH